MSAPRFFVDQLRPGAVELTPDDSRHALRSLRLRPNEPVTLADGRGQVGTGRLAGENRGRAVVQIERVEKVESAKPVVTVALAPPKGERLRWAVQKLAELGVDRMVVLRTERSVRAWEDTRVENALARLRTTAREAAMQSRQAFLMVVEDGGELNRWLESASSSKVLLWERAELPLRMGLPPTAGDVALLIGPEGGFSEAEVGAAQKAGANVASLGPNVLRTETAAVVAASLALAHYGRLG
ncbi:MAG TPA: RsmE family RNA methyltransferase [Actinomycetota bacterium]|nr:RsmE family RNA methyltransferase [Actinomycetota bacterium]